MKRALDLCCSAGGATKGLQRAGFHVTGIDIKPQPRYCGDAFIQGDMLQAPVDISQFDFVWASPHCQRYTALRSVFDSTKYPDQVAAVRELLTNHAKMWCIENVVGAPLRVDLMLCAAMFGLRSYRHRIFECSFPIAQPPHEIHLVRVNRKKENRRRHWDAGGFVSVVGDTGAYVGPEAMGIDWMTGNELSQAIPPAYAEYIGRAALTSGRALT